MFLIKVSPGDYVHVNGKNYVVRYAEKHENSGLTIELSQVDGDKTHQGNPGVIRFEPSKTFEPNIASDDLVSFLTDRGY